MSDVEEIGNVEKNLDETEIEWKIPEFLSVAENKISMKCPSFSFVDTSWHLRMYPRSTSKPGFVNLYLLQVGNLECSVEYYFGLKKVDGSIEHLTKGILTLESNCWEENGMIHRYTNLLFFKLSEVQQRKSELTPSDVLTVICTLKRETSRLRQVKLLKLPELQVKEFQKLAKLDTLSENFKSLLLIKESCDTTLHVMGKEYKAHRAVLMARSSVFAAMFLHETLEKQTGIVNIPDCDPESFEEFLEFLYSGKLETPSSRGALSLYETSDKYNIQELKTLCSEILIENMTVEYFCDTVILADKYDDTKLLYAAQCFFTNNLSNVLVTSQWECFLKNNHHLANKLLIKMSSMVKAVMNSDI